MSQPFILKIPDANELVYVANNSIIANRVWFGKLYPFVEDNLILFEHPGSKHLAIEVMIRSSSIILYKRKQHAIRINFAIRLK